MITLGVESSCDDTGLALYSCTDGLLAHYTYSQTDEHQPYGGVVPEIAARAHSERIVFCYNQLMSKTKKRYPIDAVAYTAGPGLIGALMVGACFGYAIACARQIPAIPIHHLEGHLLSVWLPQDKPEWPCLCLLVSGGHTALILASKLGNYKIIGQTLDDAAGEAFDKTAKLMGLTYPGGPQLAKLAETGDENKYAFTMPLRNRESLDFSFSGIKSAALRHWQGSNKSSQVQHDLAASFQKVVVHSLVRRVVKAMTNTGVKNVTLAGGVSANKNLRQALQEAVCLAGGKLTLPRTEFCTDNAAMIAKAGFHRLQQGEISHQDLSVYARWSIEDL